jgi:hypothetical protein
MRWNKPSTSIRHDSCRTGVFRLMHQNQGSNSGMVHPETGRNQEISYDIGCFRRLIGSKNNLRTNKVNTHKGLFHVEQFASPPTIVPRGTI